MTEPTPLPVELEMPALEPTHAIELVASPAESARRRLTPGAPQIAELFLVNSRYDDYAARVNAADPEIALARRAHLETFTNARGPEGSMRAYDFTRDLDAEVYSFIADPHGRDALFGADVFLLEPPNAWRLIAAGPLWWRHCLLEDNDIRAVEYATGVNCRDTEMLVVACAPWRYMQLIGPRGLRRSLADVGAIVAMLNVAARARGNAWTERWDFLDNVVDEALLLDGIERTGCTVLHRSKTSGGNE